ncbi:flavin-containing amine oxidasedehydrogenase-like protein [Lineolata rhizophorae]|uniref:Flavin-containing amine oxidasedehydrogenase-like protein n=1 Tax=Lineolata rhizophorae TaxID=578093 RepID=A0A6A6PDS2_9PEZI|nr:flavin-containing amine oxidasedehydrogenase-like protein [Lineolata rhizophorae]
MAPHGQNVDKRKNIVIVGAGAAGMSCAATLANHPDNFKVTVIERMPYCGGQATSISLDKKKYGTSWMNDGVQGGSPAFKHTGHFMEKYGHLWQEVRLQVGFGKGEDNFWTNVFPTHLVEKHQKDIRKFGKVLKLIKYLMPVLGLVPIKYMLKLFLFNKDFGDKMVIPLIALFLGTGNQTPNVACAILERLFDDPNMRLWNYDEGMLLPNLPEMVTFPKLRDFYQDWQGDLESKGVKFRLNTDVTKIISRDSKGVVLQTRPFDATLNEQGRKFAPQVIHDPRGGWTGPPSDPESYDELVMCVLADAALKILGGTASLRERFVLGGAAFFDDITITHSDNVYFDKIYEPHFEASLAAQPRSKAEEEHLAFAKGEVATNASGEPSGYRPMYFTHSYNEAGEPQKIEMSFDVTNYQHQFRMDHGADVPPIPYERHVFQSIFLDKRNADLWTMPEIDPSKVIESKWWHQLGHRWQHYLRVVPGMMWLNGKRRTWFAGSWTLVNMHEIACVSGIAAAYRLGADYEVFDDYAEDLFKKYLLLSHGVRYKRGKRKQT